MKEMTNTWKSLADYFNKISREWNKIYEFLDSTKNSMDKMDELRNLMLSLKPFIVKKSGEVPSNIMPILDIISEELNLIYITNNCASISLVD